MTDRRRIGCVVLNYRTPELVLDCLGSLLPQLSPADEAVVVDNASGDGSAELLLDGITQRGWPVRLVASPTNGGFAAGMNLGMRSVEADAYLLLNSDTLLREGLVERLWETLQDEPSAGVVSPALEWPEGDLQVNCFRFHSPLSELLHAAKTDPLTRLLRRWEVPIHDAQHPPREPAWTSFAAVLLRARAVEQVGPLDEGYFLYYEDVDYCWRLRQAGWRVLHEPRARLVHLHSRSSGMAEIEAARARRPAYLYAARRRYFERVHGVAGAALANALWSVGRGISLARELVGHKRPHTARRQLLDTWR